MITEVIMNTMTKRRMVIVMMLLVLLLAAMGGSASARSFRQADEEMGEMGVTGKTEEAPGSRPWTVALVEDGYSARESQFCGGTLIASQWVLTAAHCIEGMTAADMDVVVGRDRLSSSQGERIDAAQLIPHPDYDEFDDIALIRLARPATAGQPIKIVTAATEYLDDAPTVAHISGWGIIPERGEEYSPDALHGVDVPIVTLAQCQTAYGSDVDSSVICAGLEQGGADSCNGDSGGPLVVPDGGGWALAGIVSWGDGCGLPGKYGVYTRVASYEGWITGYLNGTTPPPAADSDSGSDGSSDSDNSGSIWQEWDDWFGGWDGDEADGGDAAFDDTEFGEAEATYSEEMAVGSAEVYDQGAFTDPVASLAISGVESELVTVNGVEMLLEDWSDGYGPYFIGLLVVDGRLLEIHSEVSADAVIAAAREVTG
jgi:secreted trypsin-like serine protease